MTADTLLKQARPEEALDQLQTEIRRKPGEASLRLKLFQVLVVLGRWDRASAQLETAASLDPKVATACDLLGGLIELERWRESVFDGAQKPVVEPAADWLEALTSGCSAKGTAEVSRAVKAHGRAMKQAPTRAGRIDGNAFEWIMDADARFGPSIELYAEGNYTWLPLEHVRSIVFLAPQEFVDLVWLPVKLMRRTGELVSGHVPARYPRTGSAKDAALQLARTVAWEERAPHYLTGTGVRVFSTDNGDYPVTKARLLEFFD